MRPLHRRSQGDRRLDRAAAQFEIPVAALRRAARGVHAGRYVGASQRRKARDESLAIGAGADVAAEQQYVGVGIERGAPGRQVGGARPQRRIIDQRVAQLQPPRVAVRDDVDRIQIALAGKHRVDLRQAVGIAAQLHDFDIDCRATLRDD